MSTQRKICVVTGTRAEYGLLTNLMRLLKLDKEIDLQIIVTCMHLSPEFGLTYKCIEEDGFTINKKIEILLSSDTPTAITKSMGMALISFGDAFQELKPDLLILLGDRFEILAVAVAASVCRIPIAHIHGGELTLGAMDDAFRHSITKMSHFHFCSTEVYKNRVIQMGEEPDRVFNFGAIGLDNIVKIKLLTKTEFEKAIDFKLNKKNILVTFHPVTLENNTSKNHFKELLAAFDTLCETNIIFTKANADTDGRVINKMIDDYVATRPNAKVYSSLGQLKYLSAVKNVDIVIGNSSSGIIEVPFLKTPTINIGDRQLGRLYPESVLNCIAVKKNILNAIEHVLSDNFKIKITEMRQLYGDGKTSEKIFSVIKKVDLKNILKKNFYDINL